ncbi:unnamed protein product [Spirodela intermedia]|uniref:Uncharacterized protein n=2 Tax=Spirodela intermedia TaxID=51605 RepID=A0A7I8LLF9_SPIIN|nr:unnamed protein product [Spirodela intermedia]CAA6673472.1 unnamed protein product [Spirodela intermedia]CAA7410702.1 unnamed protein product [Spirodela intermedia]
MIWARVRRSWRCGFAHSTSWCCPLGRRVSIARFPVSISSSTTPNP